MTSNDDVEFHSYACVKISFQWFNRVYGSIFSLPFCFCMRLWASTIGSILWFNDEMYDLTKTSHLTVIRHSILLIRPISIEPSSLFSIINCILTTSFKIIFTQTRVYSYSIWLNGSRWENTTKNFLMGIKCNYCTF